MSMMGLVDNRLNALRKLLSQEKLSTQDELREELEAMKYKVTQSTISRDLRKLGAVRATDPDGRTVYRLDDENSIPVASGRLADMVTEIADNGSLIVIHTTPGSASLIARHLDSLRPGEIIGTIAGDDTVFVAPPSSKAVASVRREVEKSFST